MTGQQDLIEDDSPHDRYRDHEADFTPAPLVSQLFGWIASRTDLRVRKFLDMSAGAGVFGREAKRTWPNSYRVAVEPRIEEHDHLEHNCNEVFPCTFDTAMRSPRFKDHRFDLAATNPPFTLALDFVRKVMAANPPGMLALLQLDDFGQRSDGGVKVFGEFCPWVQLRIPGAIKFRTGINPKSEKPYTADLRSYSWWIWTPTTIDSKMWVTENLPRLPACDRQWKVRPGTEKDA